ncbi:hypothetical protein JT359_09335 [Candidatus Poribacteria bacterium]|nr:hypothetical protein [Candidatus Poribacteria bacterium]
MNITIKATYILLICVVIIACGQGGDRFLWKYDKVEDVYHINLKSFGIVSSEVELADGTIVEEIKPITVVVKDTLTDINNVEPTEEEVVSVTKQVVEELVEQANEKTPDSVDSETTESGTTNTETTDTSRETNQELFPESPTEEEVNTIVEGIVDSETESVADSTNTAPEDGISLSPVETEIITQQAQNCSSYFVWLNPSNRDNVAEGNSNISAMCRSFVTRVESIDSSTSDFDGNFLVTTNISILSSELPANHPDQSLPGNLIDYRFSVLYHRTLSSSSYNSTTSFNRIIQQMKDQYFQDLGLTDFEDEQHHHGDSNQVSDYDLSINEPDTEYWHTHGVDSRHRHLHVRDSYIVP